MKLPAAARENFLSGVLFMALGIGSFWVSRDYPFGGLTEISTGFFPVVLSVLLTVLGACICAAAFIGTSQVAESPPQPPFQRTARPLFYVILSLLVFALMVRPWGLAAATVALVLIGSRADHGFPLALAFPLALGLAAVAVGIFVYGLGLPFRVWP